MFLSWITSLYALFFAYYAIIVSSIIVEDPDCALSCRKGFVLGQFHFSNYTFHDIDWVLGSKCDYFRHLGEEYSHGGLEALALSVEGWSLETISASKWELFHSDMDVDHPRTREQLSNEVCTSIMYSSAGSLAEKEMVYQLALVLDPRNMWMMKNYAFHLEWQGFHIAVDDLYRQCIVLTGNAGCLVQYIFLAPPILETVEQQRRLEATILSRMKSVANFLATTPLEQRGIAALFDPVMDIRELPLNPQYTGANANAMYALWSMILVELYPSLSSSILPMQGRISSGQRTGEKLVIKLGIVSESGSNSSPLLCFFPILEAMLAASPHIHMHYFAREEDRFAPYIFEQRVREVATEVSFLASNNLQAAREAIAAADVDILLYLALPTEKFTFLLAHARLAPVQLQYGVGHPLSSGVSSSAMDYYVIPLDMVDEPAFHDNTERMGAFLDGVDTNGGGFDGDGDSSSLPVPLPVAVSTGQTVYLSELGYYMHHPLDFYTHGPGSAVQGCVLEECAADYPGCVLSDPDVRALKADPHRFVAEQLSCGKLARLLEQWQVGANLTAAMLYSRCAPEAEDKDQQQSSKPPRFPLRTLYFCIQLPKKLHPAMDPLLFGILERDPSALIVLSSKALGVVDRWRRARPTLSEAEVFTQFLFLPRLSHLHHLTLLAMSAVFLNPLPFGAGVTSSEALALCVPIVAYSSSVPGVGVHSRTLAQSSRSSILQFALAQIATLGPEFVERMVVYSSSVEGVAGEMPQEDIDRYVSRAVELASRSTSADILRRDICSVSSRLFGSDQLERVTAEWQQLLERLV